MHRNIFIFHGTEGHPQENWFPWLKEKLQAKGCKVVVPQFPSPPVIPSKIEEWFSVFKGLESDIDENSIIIGHSLGGVFTLRVLEKLNKKIFAAIFVGTPIGVKPIKYYDRDNAFSGFDFDWNKIKESAQYFIVYQSDDDPYVALANGEELAKRLGVKLIFIPNAGHFNARAGYTEFKDLLKKVEDLI